LVSKLREELTQRLFENTGLRKIIWAHEAGEIASFVRTIFG